MLLNEYQKQQRKIMSLEKQATELAELKLKVEQLTVQLNYSKHVASIDKR